MQRPSQQRLVILAVACIVAGLLVSWGVWTKLHEQRSTTDGVTMTTADQGQVLIGRQVFIANCAVCHGANAEGAPNWRQADSQGNLPPPPHDDTGHTWRHSDAELAGIIRDGMRDYFNKSPDLTMPPFGNQLSDEEIAALITYFQSLWSPEHRAYQDGPNQRPPMVTATPEVG